MISQKAQLFRELPAAADRHAAITRPAKILRRKEAEECGVSERSRAPRAATRGIFCSDGLCRIFDDRQAIGHDGLAKRIHCAADSKQVNGNDRANAVAARGDQSAIGSAGKAQQAAPQSFGIHVKCVGRDVHENRLRTDSMNAARGRKKTIGRRDDGVARADPHRHENRKQSIRARGHANRMRAAYEFAKGLFKLLDRTAQE